MSGTMMNAMMTFVMMKETTNNMFRVLDMNDHSLLAIAFTEEIAKHILKMFPDVRCDNDPETVRYVYEDCFQTGVMESTMTQIDVAAHPNHCKLHKLGCP